MERADSEPRVARQRESLKALEIISDAPQSGPWLPATVHRQQLPLRHWLLAWQCLYLSCPQLSAVAPEAARSVTPRLVNLPLETPDQCRFKG